MCLTLFGCFLGIFLLFIFFFTLCILFFFPSSWSWNFDEKKRHSYTMSRSHSAQMFWPGGRPFCGDVGCGLVSGADTDLNPVKVGNGDDTTPPPFTTGSAVYFLFLKLNINACRERNFFFIFKDKVKHSSRRIFKFFVQVYLHFFFFFCWWV